MILLFYSRVFHWRQRHHWGIPHWCQQDLWNQTQRWQQHWRNNILADDFKLIEISEFQIGSKVSMTMTFPKLTDSEPVWYRTHVIQNPPTRHRAHLILNLLDIEPIRYKTCQIAFSCCMSKLHVRAACPCSCCLSIPLYIFMSPCRMSMLHVQFACPCCISMLHAYPACPY